MLPALHLMLQALAYNEMFRAKHTRPHYQDIVDRTNFLVLHYDEIVSHTTFDGMLVFALQSYEVTQDPTCLAKAAAIVAHLESMHSSQLTLNGGLIAAMALSKYYVLTGDPVALNKAKGIIVGLGPYQHADGSFPHYCYGSTDIHYTAWMGMELVIIQGLRWLSVNGYR